MCANTHARAPRQKSYRSATAVPTDAPADVPAPRPECEGCPGQGYRDTRPYRVTWSACAREEVPGTTSTVHYCHDCALLADAGFAPQIARLDPLDGGPPPGVIPTEED